MPGCALTQDLVLDCRDSMGGLKNLFVIEFANVTNMTETAGVITALTKGVGKKFYKYELPRETGNMKSAAQASEQNGSIFYNHEVKAILNKLQTSIRNELILLAKNKLVIVGEDRNGKFWMAGRTGGLFLTSGTADTGTASGDRSGFEFDFAGQEPEPIIEVNNTVGAALQTPG